MARLIGVVFALTFAGVMPVQAGSLSGTVTVAGTPAPDSVVYVSAVPGRSFPPPAVHAVMDQRNMRFIPHVLPVQVGTTVDFENHDSVDHNVFSPDACAPEFNLGTWGQGQVRSHTFPQPCEAVILCAIHPKMEAFVVVVPTPYFAKTAETGVYSIADLADGRYAVTAWHDGAVQVAREVVVSGATTLDFALQQ